MNGKDNNHSDAKVGEKVLKKLLDSGVPHDVTDKDGRQPLLWAASAGQGLANYHRSFCRKTVIGT
jgi:ankyrin repeat protein